jgi:hypothetical protein
MKNSNLFFYYSHGIAGAILYSIPVILFTAHTNFDDQWLLYVGNFLLLGLTFLTVIQFNKKLSGTATIGSMINTGIKVTFISIAISCMVLIVLVFLDKYKVLEHAPGEVSNGKKNGLWFTLFADAILVNIFVGAFAAVIAAVSSKNYRKETGTS